MTDMREMIDTLGDQLRWAGSLSIEEVGRHEEVVVAGMGGSGVSGDYLAAASHDTATRVAVHKGYGPLPGWVSRARPLVIAVSYSGNTEETIDFVTAADSAGLPIATITTGGELGRLTSERAWPGVVVPAGLQPRAALGYLVGSVATVAAAAGAVRDPRRDLEEAADIADSALAEGSPAWETARAAATGLAGRITIVYGGGPVSNTVAARWKTQINENAKMPAWWSVLPELDHNELVGWEAMPEMTQGSVGIVALTDRSDHPRVAARRRHSADLTSSAVPWIAEIPSWGESALARLISLTTVGDLASWMMAEQAGVDPVPVVTIEKLKKLLTED